MSMTYAVHIHLGSILIKTNTRPSYFKFLTNQHELHFTRSLGDFVSIVLFLTESLKGEISIVQSEKIKNKPPVKIH